MNRTLTALSVSLLAFAALAPALLGAGSAAAQSGAQTEANRRLAFLRTVSGDRSWLCAMSPIGRTGPDVNVRMSLALSPDQSASATTISTTTLGGRSYSATYRLSGRARARADGRATIWLSQSRMVRADALPNGLNWSDTSSVRLSFEVIPDTVSSGRYRYMLRGRQSDDMGGSTIFCAVDAEG
ncbi:MAG: hypothetical protein KKA37_00730 [Alphaproteobacteria bacterium]|nr:hypothetical protein [Alphaproteobacteria bacterium]MBU2040520.1 hypothetical protein [Alphaproteobacteria bacterium]MBU2124606.1 hypothetical protein [Alphaproteobacteria bacterium]MBU2207447.1 hypothetical protein [Alphaproteobacteria bacterium]MBU2397830.1 hypothetical protein [Alphaproteobacteria bacterium]